MIGETLGSYKILSRLGAGGMGEVYLAQHSRIDRRAAIKVLLPELSSNAEVVERFFAEARSTSSIRHRGIVEVLDCDVHPSGRAYIVMELLEGDSLAARLARDPDFGRNHERVLAVARDVADAVGAAHAKGIVHRDLKPDNIFLVNDDRTPLGFAVKILDFGIAKLMGGREGDRPGSLRTRTGSMLGTPAYMSPEQCRGAALVDHRTDIYSFGCIVFEMLAGRRPFLYEGFGELISAHITEAAPSLESIGVDVPPPIARWVQRLLAKSADDRFASMAGAIEALRDAGQRTTAIMPTGSPGGPSATGTAVLMPAVVATRRPGTAMLPPAPAFAPTPTTTTFSSAAGEHVPARSAGRRWAFVAGGAGVALVIVGAIVLRPRAADAPNPAAATPSRPESVTITVSDAPAGLRVWVDGAPGDLPILLPAGSDTHQLRFRAPGFTDRTLSVDGTTSRLLTLALEPRRVEPATEPPPPAATGTTTPARTDKPPAADVPGEARRHRRHGSGAADTNVDVRKL